MQMDREQAECVSKTGTDILVSASAGAGKTRVLVERLIKRIVTDHVSLDEVLAVTFTEAAAGEMKKRVAGRLNEELQTGTDRSWIENQLILLSRADITTIDSFCLNIIKKYFSVIGLDPAIALNIIDDSKKSALEKKAFEQAVISLNREKPEELLQLFLMFSPRSEDYDSLKTTVFDIISHADTQADPEEWMQKALASAKSPRSWKDVPEKIRHCYMQSWKLEYDTLQQKLDLMILAIEQNDSKVMPEDIIHVKNRLSSCERYLEQKDYDLFRESFINWMEDPRTPADTKCKPYTDARTSYDNQLKKIIKELFPTSVLLEDFRGIVTYQTILVELSARTMHNFRMIKQAEGVMDFADMERYAWEIIKANDFAVAKLYRQRLKEVMVDEFQDTSFLQNLIIQTISPKGTIFRVGDVKQSIYRFRGARPSLMRNLEKDPDIYSIHLRHNYRSKENIVMFSNVLFQRLMNVPGLEDRYGEDDIVSTGADYQLLKEPDPIKFILIETPDPDSEEESKNSKRLKAEWIAAEILRLIETEGCRYSDFALLLRNHDDKRTIRKAFDSFNIPYDIDAREGFFNSPLCSTIRCLLNVLLDSGDEVSLLSVLTSSFYDIPDETLAQWKIQYRSVYNGVCQQHPEIFTEFEELRNISRAGGITALLDAIALHHQFYDSLDSSSKANFDFLYEKATALEKNSRSIYDLIELMSADSGEKSSYASSIGKDEDVVTVTTIHQSKGLQYKIVFIWSTSTNRNMDSSSMVLVDDDLYLGLNAIDMPWRTSRSSIQRSAIEYKQNAEDLEEYTRLLYVALTRAENKMYIVDVMPKRHPIPAPATFSMLAQRKGMTGLILSVLGPQKDLFEIIEVTPAVVTPAAAIRSSYVKNLPVFNGQVKTYPASLRPSDTELTELPDLDLESNGTGYGTTFHETIENLPDRTWEQSDFYYTGLSANDIGKLIRFSKSEIYQKALTMEIRKEFPFYVLKDDISITGSMDFVAVNETEIILIDFKTDACEPEEILKRYSLQLNTYRKALEIIYPSRQISVYAYSFHNEVYIPVEEE